MPAEPTVPDATTGPSWDEVLSSLTAQADEAEAMLETDHPVAPSAVAYDFWSLTMPPMSTGIEAQARALAQRHQELVMKLQDAMAEIRHQEAILDLSSHHRSPIFVDQRA